MFALEGARLEPNEKSMTMEIWSTVILCVVGYLWLGFLANWIMYFLLWKTMWKDMTPTEFAHRPIVAYFVFWPFFLTLIVILCASFVLRERHYFSQSFKMFKMRLWARLTGQSDED